MHGAVAVNELVEIKASKNNGTEFVKLKLPATIAPGTYDFADPDFGFRAAYYDDGIDENLKPRQNISVQAKATDGSTKKFEMLVRLDTPVEIDYFRNGGILQTVLRKLAK